MLFTFKRDKECCERIYVGDVCVARFIEAIEDPVAHKAMGYKRLAEILGVDQLPLGDAIECADEAGFWLVHRLCTIVSHSDFVNNEIEVSVPIADNAILTVETEGGDEA